MKANFRQSMSWLHTWAGLLLGWLLFAVFLTGTIAYFRQEVTLWMQPELHGSVPSPRAAELGLAKLAEVAPDASSWTVNLPADRNETLRVSWREAASAERDAGRGGGRGEGLILDASTGEVLKPRATAGGNFLYRFHFELHAMPRAWARTLVGIATLVMFIAIISGIITHRRFFMDFFTFRPSKGQRSWLDAHNVTAVLALPFHMMITYSGLLLVAANLLPWSSQVIFGDNPRAAMAAGRAAEQKEAEALKAELAKLGGGTSVPIPQLMAEAEREWGQPVSRITVSEPGKPGSIVELLPTRNDSLILESGSGGLGGVKLAFVAKTGERLSPPEPRARSFVGGLQASLGSLHRARFASVRLRWVFFLAGVCGTLMIATGLVLWSVKRAEKRKGARGTFGHRLVDHLNVGAVAGLCVAVAAYFWANRLLPVDLASRGDREIQVFFAVWALTCLHPLARPLRSAWLEQLGAAGLLFVAIPVLNALTTDSHLGVTIPAGKWLIAGFDIVAFVTGLAMLHAARKVWRRRQPAAPVASRPSPSAPPAAAVAVES
ncbi:PepSY-associated TM helix domain-containing protein [Myxococcus vastator]|uniref:PepSY-associated TM helix domain-containing protein n=1 Tax=Myxococcus vastator TaxID=2709664 RepID=UPI001967F6B3|nr:PepSY-associated TM helix domain-containing protein [Myxococcus vastator]